MKECIEREAALSVFGGIHPLDYNSQTHYDLIKKIPAADVRHVVNCKKCEWWDIEWAIPDSDSHFCPMTELFTSPEWYCADGSMKMAGQNEV